MLLIKRYFDPTRTPPLALASTLALLAGAAFALCSLYAPWLQPLALAWLVCAIPPGKPSSLSRVWLLGFVFGMGWFGVSVWWLFISMHVYGGMVWPLATAALLAFCAYLSLFPALALVLTGYLQMWRPLAFAAAWCASEWLRGQLFTGFPWAATGYAHTDTPLAALAAVGGIDSINFAVALIAGGVAWGVGAVLGHNSIKNVATISIAAITTAFITFINITDQKWTEPAGNLSVALLQTNIGQGEKFAAARIADNLSALQQMLEVSASNPSSPDLIVTPETAIPVLPEQLPDDYLKTLTAPLAQNGVALLVGIPLTLELGNGRSNFTNSVLGFMPGAAAAGKSAKRYRYDKHHLVPFGEFIPFGFRWFVDAMRMPLGDFWRGAIDQPAFELKGQRIAPTICYEDVFGDELRARFTDAATAPTLFANVTNLAWFGDTFAIDQHLAIARLRSLEFGRASIRATNTGATVIIDHQGKVSQQLPPWTRGTLSASVQGRNGLTPYARYGAWPILIFSFAVLLLCVFRLRATRS